MTQVEFGVHSGLYLQEYIATDVYTQGLVVVDRTTLLGFGQVVVWADTWEHDNAKGRISHVNDPLYRYLHRTLSSSITARGHNREWCTSVDVFFFYCLLYRRPCALAHGVAPYFASAHHRQERGFLYGGAYVTIIACSLGHLLEADPKLLPPRASTRMVFRRCEGWS
ncbi:hypothetical protein Hanom_Chr04g00317561 [Helianthus anomalus]